MTMEYHDDRTNFIEGKSQYMNMAFVAEQACSLSATQASIHDNIKSKSSKVLIDLKAARDEMRNNFAIIRTLLTTPEEERTGWNEQLCVLDVESSESANCPTIESLRS